MDKVSEIGRKLEKESHEIEENSRRSVDEMKNRLNDLQLEAEQRISNMVEKTHKQVLRLEEVEIEEIKKKVYGFQSMLDNYTHQMEVLVSQIELIKNNSNG